VNPQTLEGEDTGARDGSRAVGLGQWITEGVLFGGREVGFNVGLIKKGLGINNNTSASQRSQ